MKRILILFLACIMLVLSMPLTVLCAETQKTRVEYIDLSKTSVEDDFKGVDLSEYVRDTSADRIEVISLVEQGYAANRDFSNYALYLYVYNPTVKKINLSGNSIELAESIDYKNIFGVSGVKYGMTLIDSTEDNLIVKFKINVFAGFPNTLTKTKRAYNIVGIEINHNGLNNLTDFSVGGSYTYTGYERYYTDDVSTLKCDVETFEVIGLDVKYSTFRNTSGLGLEWQNQLTSIYFGIPNRVLKEYNNELYGIDIQYEKYYTKPIIVTNDRSFYDTMKPYEGKILSFDTEKGIYCSDVVPKGASSYDEEYAQAMGGVGIWKYTYTYSFNEEFKKGNSVNVDNCYLDNRIPLLIYHDGDIDEKTFIPQETVLSAYEYCYTQAYADKFLALNEDMRKENFSDYNNSHYGLYYNSILFEDYFFDTETGEKINAFVDDSGVITGALFEKRITFDGEPYNMISYKDSTTWWERFLNFGFFGPKQDISFLDIPPIQKLDRLDIVGMENSEIATSYYVDEAESGKLKADVLDNYLKNQTTYIFRIDQDLYKSESVKSNGKKIGFYAQQPVYMGLDVINLVFKNENGSVIAVPVVSDPKNVIGGLTPDVPTQNPNDLEYVKDNIQDDWAEFMATLKKFIMVIMGVFVFILILPFLLDGLKLVSKSTASSIRTLTGSNENRKTKFKRKK